MATPRKPQDRKPAKRKSTATPAQKVGAITTATEWKSDAGHDVEVPSGKVARCRRPGLETFVVQGLIPNPLMAIVDKAMNGEQQELKISDLDITQLESVIELYDAVTIYCVIQPEVHRVPEDGELRDGRLLYVDEVDFMDKQFIFQWAVGGTSSVEQFREELAATLRNVQPGNEMESKAK